MHLPNVERAIIPAEKVRDYLLAPDHRVGRSKARFFGGLGFRQDAWPVLRDALLALARDGRAEPRERTIFGQKYVVPGILQGPAGRTATVVTAWIVLRGEDVPRFVTAYPAEPQR
jgi:hypothetical protein